jgi:hypothetical protein
MDERHKINRQPSDFDPFPGEPRSDTHRAVKAGRDAARAAGQHVPLIARPYNGWERR